MVIKWLVMVNNNLVGGAITILKNDGVRQWVSGDNPYMKWKIKNVPNHQPDFNVVPRRTLSMLCTTLDNPYNL
jgi:hypothetical protein